MKRCRKCGELKPLTEFHKNCIAPDGLRPRCKKCTNAALVRRYRYDYEYRERKLKADRKYKGKKAS